MKILITGGCGFIGHHLVEHVCMNTDWDIVIVDKLNYASNGFERLREIKRFKSERLTVFTHDICVPFDVGMVSELQDVDYIAHLGAETHVDNSIDDPKPFVMSNVLGTMCVLDLARKISNLKKMCYFSTDEVFGPADSGILYKEWDRYHSSNPYAASKAGGEELCLAYQNTYKVPVYITHTMNCFGERQHIEKFIPMVISKVLNGEKVIIHSDKTKTVSGSRFWIHARNAADAVLFLMKEAVVGDKYNIVGEEYTNFKIASFIAETLEKELIYEFVDFHSSRPGHDLRYSLDGTKMRNMGWESPIPCLSSLKKSILWTLENKEWLK